MGKVNYLYLLQLQAVAETTQN